MLRRRAAASIEGDSAIAIRLRICRPVILLTEAASACRPTNGLPMTGSLKAEPI